MIAYLFCFALGTVSTLYLLMRWLYWFGTPTLERVWTDLVTARCLIRTTHIKEAAEAVMKSEAPRPSVPPWMSHP